MNTDVPQMFISYTKSFKLTKIFGKTIIPATVDLSAEILEVNTADSMLIDLAIRKVNFFFDSIVQRSIAFSRYNQDALDIVIDSEGTNRTGNLVMMLPDEPVDYNLAIIFQAKMNALVGDVLEFGVIDIKTDNHHNLSYSVLEHNDHQLPSLVDWLGTDKYYYDVPWWHRGDGTTFDVLPIDDSIDFAQPPHWEYSLDFLNIGAAFSEISDTQNGSENVIRPQFKPTIIKGGKEE